MERVDSILSILDYTLNTKRKRQIAGGILMSAALLFGGLALTVMSLREEENDNEQYLE